MKMNYYIYKLRFLAPVHFGAHFKGIGLEKVNNTCSCDTLFGAIANEVLKLDGQEGIEALVRKVENNELLLSDTFPYYKDRLYIPRPIIILDREQGASVQRENNKKKLKKMPYIPVSHLEAYMDFVKKGTPLAFDVDEFGMEFLTNKVKLSFEEKPQPYSVGAYQYRQEAGVYFIVGMEQQDKSYFDNIMKALQYSGIGGKRSAGYGMFELETIGEDYSGILAKLNQEAEVYLSLSTIIPNSTDLEILTEANNFYMLTQSSGFVNSPKYSDIPLKRKTVAMLQAGSCFGQRLNGSLVDLSSGDTGHKVYRYGKPIFMGVNA
jgi:CRISPR-associated protein Csm4